MSLKAQRYSYTMSTIVTFEMLTIGDIKSWVTASDLGTGQNPQLTSYTKIKRSIKFPLVILSGSVIAVNVNFVLWQIGVS